MTEMGDTCIPVLGNFNQMAPRPTKCESPLADIKPTGKEHVAV